jgi:hypothetical protein
MAPLLLTSSLDGGERSDSRPSRFNPVERDICTLWIVGWVGAPCRSVHCRKEKNLAPVGNRNSAVQHVARRYTEVPDLYLFIYLFYLFYLR